MTFTIFNDIRCSLVSFFVRDHEPKYGDFESKEDADDLAEPNVVDLKPLLAIRSGVTKKIDQCRPRDIFQELQTNNVRISRAIAMFEELVIDIEPLKNRINNLDGADLSAVLAHMLEYLETIVRAYDLRVNRVPVVAVHPYKKMNDAALKYADELENPARREQFFRFYEWIKDLDTCYRLVRRG